MGFCCAKIANIMKRNKETSLKLTDLQHTALTIQIPKEDSVLLLGGSETLHTPLGNKRQDFPRHRSELSTPFHTDPVYLI